MLGLTTTPLCKCMKLHTTMRKSRLFLRVLSLMLWKMMTMHLMILLCEARLCLPDEESTWQATLCRNPPKARRVGEKFLLSLRVLHAMQCVP